MKITHEKITQRAFEIWERQGKPEGREQEHWFRAEEELRKEKVKAPKSEAGFVRQKTP